jgi:hypothetical protein
MLYYLLLNIAIAQQLVVVNSEGTNTDGVALDLDDNAETILWSDLQQLPLSISNAEIKGKCAGLAKSLEDVETALSGVGKSLDYIELEKADGHMRRVENSFRCLNEIAPASLLSKAYFLSGLTDFYREDNDSAVTDWQQAIVFDSSIEWDDQFEPSGKPLFDSTKDELKSIAEAQLVIFPSTATIIIDGEERNSGDSIPAGLHLIQHGKDNTKSYFVQVEAGSDVTLASFVDFPSDLNELMSDSNLSQEFLMALRRLPDFDDYRLVSTENYWSLSMGGDTWKSTSISSTKAVDLKPKVDTKKNRGTPQNLPEVATIADKKRHPVLTYASIGALGLGGVSLVLAKNRYDDYLLEGDPTVAATLAGKNAMLFWTGTGLSVAGGGLLVAGTVKW